MASKRFTATRSAARTSSVEDSGISFTALAMTNRFGTNNATDRAAGGSRALHHRSAVGYGR
ncbi:hypothetical protein [Haloplanus sp.]|jgi:hypothetical protein|uniref:hypothetical protein n=1 Tax=Haloplanus sp. TaxID=1961696 RepID=UPI002630B9B1|nr:hypothetical protein [Haloplanus sp.]